MERAGDTVGDVATGVEESELGIVWAKLENLDGTGANSDGVGWVGFATELQGKLSSYNGRRAMGTPFRNCDG